MILTIVVFLLILSVLVLAHELGHFATAKWCGVKVEEFGMGFPPRLFSIQRGETVYSLNAIPFGGFTKLLGEEDPSASRSFASKSHACRFLILVAGSIMNLLLPVLLFTISFMVPHDIAYETVSISQVAAESPAQVAGIEAGDRLLKIDNHDIKNRGNVAYYIQLKLGSTVDFLIQKSDGSEEIYTLKPRWAPPPGEGATGIMIAGADTVYTKESLPFWEAIPQASVHSWEIIVLFRNEITKWFVGSSAPQLSGPIGIAQLTGEVVKGGVSPVLELAALISISLGIFNLLPIPGLDGGRILFVALEWFRRGKRISPQKEGLVHTIGFIMLLALIIVISYFDVIRLISGESLIP
ncbi:MAG TPA: M50 family metallopeptidase [Dehalococcoidia bacterium]|nr:M50 family metallopeptidase [Dehalococcoidia bacterium]